MEASLCALHPLSFDCKSATNPQSHAETDATRLNCLMNFARAGIAFSRIRQVSFLGLYRFQTFRTL